MTVRFSLFPLFLSLRGLGLAWVLWMGAVFPALAWFPEWHGCETSHTTATHCDEEGGATDHAADGGVHQCAFTALAQSYASATFAPVFHGHVRQVEEVLAPVPTAWVRVWDEGGWPLTQAPPRV